MKFKIYYYFEYFLVKFISKELKKFLNKLRKEIKDWKIFYM